MVQRAIWHINCLLFGSGTHVSMLVPCAECTECLSAQVQTLSYSFYSPTDAPMVTEAPTKSILLADDDPDVLWGLEKCLVRAGYSVTAVEDGLKALDVLRSRLFDLIITDVRMPGMNGLALLDWLRINRPKVQVVVMTAFSSPDLKDLCTSKGARLFLEKPVDPDLLISAISRALPHDPSTSSRA